MTTIASLIPAYLPPKPSAEAVADAAIIRKETRDVILKRYDIFMKELPTFNDAGMTIFQTNPMKNFLESEIAWWNANLELTRQQVTTRATSYIEKLQTLNKDLQVNLDTAVSLLDNAKGQAIVNAIAKVEGSEPSAVPSTLGMGPAPAPASSYGLPSVTSLFSSPASTQGFEDLGPATSPGPSPGPATVDLSGALTSIDVNLLQSAVTKKEEAEKARQATQVAKASTGWYDDIWNAYTDVSKIVVRIVYFVLAIRIAAFAANELFYKPLAYRILAFLYAFLFAPLLLPYYIYRELRYYFQMGDPPLFLSIFPVVPYEPLRAGTSASVDKRLYGWQNDAFTQGWVEKSLKVQREGRLNVLQTTGKVLAELVQGQLKKPT